MYHHHHHHGVYGSTVEERSVTVEKTEVSCSNEVNLCTDTFPCCSWWDVLKWSTTITSGTWRYQFKHVPYARPPSLSLSLVFFFCLFLSLILFFPTSSISSLHLLFYGGMHRAFDLPAALTLKMGRAIEEEGGGLKAACVPYYTPPPPQMMAAPVIRCFTQWLLDRNETPNQGQSTQSSCQI